MLKNSYSFMVLLLLTYFVSKTDTIIIDPSESTRLKIEKVETEFSKVINDVKNDIYYHKVALLLPTLATLPATIPNNCQEVSEYIDTFLHTALDMLELTMDIQFYLYTPANPYKKFLLKLSQESFDKSKFNSSLETKFLIHGFREFLPETSIIYDIRDQLLQKGRYNIIVVDWTKYSRATYNKAATNAPFIGYEIAKLIKVLILHKGISPQSIHLIAHSLGCHAAGFAGKVTPNIGRITSLDATGLLFDDLPSSLKITNTDAEFVDAIHTHGTSSYTGGLGTLLPHGDIDFFPNGGSLQPGCRFGNVYIDTNKQVKRVNTNSEFILCNHQRALHLFLESINECWFESVMCSSYNEFKDRKCPRETSVVSTMGFYAAKVESLAPNAPFYLETNDKYPFCFEHF